MRLNAKSRLGSGEASPIENEHHIRIDRPGSPPKPDAQANRMSLSGPDSTGPTPSVGAAHSPPSQSSPAPSVPTPEATPENPERPPEDTPTDDYRQEIRFAIVMYGGVSLAIYIHGVAQELLRLVRATSGADLKGDKVAEIYRKLSHMVRNQDPDRSNGYCPTRFVIDILSGTSAGGINAIFLAKALAIRSQNLEKLRQTWLDVADMDQLLNTGGALEPKRSLLKGDWMYQQLKKAFDAMNDEDLRDPEQCYRPEQVDLFVTTTDLNGATVPIRLADMNVLEKVYKGSFNFRLDNIALDSENLLDKEISNLAHDDFNPDFDPMLAFAARCTSSFPVAFAPMKLTDIKSVIGENTYKNLKDKYLAFFRWVPPESVFPQECVDLDRRELADGGYLDNKPFGYVIDAMTFRAAKLRHKRKLLYVDPFPEVAGEQECRAHFDFVENGLAAAMTLPRYQTIRDEIARVEFSNITQERVLRLRKLVNGNTREDFRKTFNETIVKADRDKSHEQTKVSELIGKFGTIYATYHEVRLLDVTDDLARIVSATHETVQLQDLFLAIRYLVRVWRKDNYQPNGEDGKQLETKFFTDFDYSFRLRRAAQLLEWAQQKLPTACDSLIQQLTRLLRTRERLSLSDRSLNPVWKEILKAKDLSWANIKAILEPITDEARLAKAQELYKNHRQSLTGIADAIKAQWKQVFDRNRDQLAVLLTAHAPLNEQYMLFDFDDMASLSFLEGSDVSEHTETEVYRISPVDGIDRPLKEKLAGYALLDFGAFLEKEWRENDMLWGRLDACERLVSVVLNDPRDKACREGFVKCLQNAIVEQEAARCTIDLAQALQASRQGNLRQYLGCRYKVPDPPKPAKSASQLAKAADILGRMIEEDVGTKNGITGTLRNLAQIAEGVVALLTPGGLGRVFFNYWLQLLGLMILLLFLLGKFGEYPTIERFALIGLALIILLAVVASILGSLLAKTLPAYVVRVIKWLPAVVVAVLTLIGCRHFQQDWQGFWLRIHGLIAWHKPKTTP